VGVCREKYVEKSCIEKTFKVFGLEGGGRSMGKGGGGRSMGSAGMRGREERSDRRERCIVYCLLFGDV